ncbi:MAG TPA: SatD family protein [Intrasporangium sp.]|uniref:SatD family protein n=1 Tax=Intrasporangium sp. TaxID=1925024 RepID=UPI002D785F30|nr:SatD family protein [Intrasporangium sp.]HET7399836.1 SatD family protein [Intrasporangium sp.]
MPHLKDLASRVVLIGDVVGSRSTLDRQALHDRLSAVLRGVNETVRALEPAVITVGDEFQGVYASLGDGLRASFLVRAGLFADADVRFGLGRGRVQVLDRARGIFDGSAFWCARAAIEQAKEQADRAALHRARTAYRCTSNHDGTGHDGTAEDGDDAGFGTAVNAALLALDHLVGAMSERSRRILRGLLDGATQHDVALAEGVSPSAVSQRVRRDGIGAALEVMERLGTLA